MPLSFSSIKDIIPIAATTFVLTGIIKALAFYYLFGIRIIDYIDFSESLLLFLDDLIIIAVGLMFAVASYFFYGNIPSSMRFIGIFIIACNSVYLFVLLRHYYHLSLYFSIVEAVALAIVSSVAFYFVYTGYRQGYPMLLFLITTFLISVIEFRIKRDYDVIVKEEPEKEVTLQFTDSTMIKTGTDTVYIGRTRKNIFCYVKSSKTALVFKEEAIKDIQIKKLKDPQIKYSF
jgi:hypothetical protein